MLASDHRHDGRARLQIAAAGAPPDEDLGARHERGDLDAEEQEEIARELIAIDIDIRLLDMVTRRDHRIPGCPRRLPFTQRYGAAAASVCVARCLEDTRRSAPQ